MQEPMNTTIHRWSYSWYRSRYCPSSIVQDGGDTAINGTVPIYFRASPDLCHHVGRGINPRGRAVTDVSFTDHFYCVVPECIDASVLVVHVVSCEISSIRTDMYHCSRIREPDVRPAGVPIAPYYVHACDSLDHVRGMCILLSFVPVWVLTFLTATFIPAICFRVFCLATVFAFQ